MHNIEPNTPPKPFALFNLGFRPFFLAAVGFAAVSMLIWMGIYIFGWTLQPFGSAQTWHAHEMIFGYTLAVIAGFLLTAVKNWTSVQTPHGVSLAVIFFLWLAARILPFISGVEIQVIALIDNLFILALVAGVGYPIFKTRQWQHAVILAILLLMLASNILFYCGLLGLVDNGVTLGLYSGLYLIMGLIFLMGRRVIPFFIEKGVDETVQLTNYKWLDISSPIIFVGFWFADLFLADPMIVAALAAVLFMLHSIRLIGWYTPGLWSKPLLWVIYLAYAALTFGFALKAAVPLLGISPFIALHAFAVGGVGVMTLGMMSRVALGHTGRNVFEPPRILGPMFTLLFIATFVRVFLPMLIPSEYILWVGVSQVFWIVAFALFFIIFLPVLLKPRIDGRFG